MLPVKLKKLTVKTRYINYFICRNGEEILVNKRIYEDIWQHLYDFPRIETAVPAVLENEEFIKEIKQCFGSDVTVLPLMEIKHLLTHQIIYVRFFALDNYIINFNTNAEAKWVTWADFDQLPQPKILTKFINNYFNK